MTDHDEPELERLLRFLTRPGLGFGLALALFGDPVVARRLREQAVQQAAAQNCRVATLELGGAGDDVDIADQIAQAITGADAVFVLDLDELLLDSLDRPRRTPAMVNFNLGRDQLPERITGRVVLWVPTRAYPALAKIAWDLLEVVLTRFEFVGVEPTRVEVPALEHARLELHLDGRASQIRARAEGWAMRADSSEDPRAEAEAASLAAISFVALTDFPRAVALFKRAASAYDRVPDPLEVARQRMWIAVVSHHRGHYDQAEDRARRAAHLANTIGNFDLEAEASLLLADIHRAQGDVAAAETQLRHVADHSEARGDRQHLATALALLGALYMTLQRVEESEAALERSAAILEELGDERGWAVSRRTLADLRLSQGRVDEAWPIYVGEVAPALEADETGLAEVLDRIARSHAAQGQHRRALAILQDEVLPTYERLGDRFGALRARLTIAELLAQRGDTSEALTLLDDDLLPEARALGAGHLEHSILRVRSRLTTP